MGEANTSLNYIVVEGPIGAGKTTLARRLAKSIQAELVLEKPEENPFLERFYDDPKRTALPVQLSFLLQRSRQLVELRQSSLFHSIRVADFMIEKDRIFAQLTLQDDEFELYEQLYWKYFSDRLIPDLVIYLQAPAGVLRDRVNQRGINYEKKIGMIYLQQLSDAYARFFHYYDTSPLLIINAEAIDFANNEKDYAALLAKIQSVRSGRCYFNPLAEAI